LGGDVATAEENGFNCEVEDVVVDEKAGTEDEVTGPEVGRTPTLRVWLIAEGLAGPAVGGAYALSEEVEEELEMVAAVGRPLVMGGVEN